MSPVTRGTPSGDAYPDLQNQARRTRRQTQEPLQPYVPEGFLARLAASAMRQRFVLKGGVLLAAVGSRPIDQGRRPGRRVTASKVTGPGDDGDSHELVHNLVVTNGSKRPIRDVECQIDAILGGRCPESAARAFDY